MPVLLNYLKAFIKLISTGKNYGVLKRALKNESPREILINLYFAVINFSKYKKTSQISILVQHAKLINERLHLKATIHSTIHLKKVQVYINKSKSYEVDVKPFTSANIYRKSNEYHLDCKLELISTGLNIVRINAEGEGKLHNFFFFKTYSHSLNENYTKYYKAIDRKYKSQYGKINLPSQFFTLIEYECKGKINIVPEENIDLNKNKLIRKRDCGFKRYSVNIEIQDELYKILYQIDSPYVIIQSQDSILGQYTFTSFYKSIENATESPILLYSDDDQIMGKTHINPHFKTNFNRTLIWSYNYVGKNFCIRTQELKEALISIKYEGDVIYALLLNIFHHHGHSILHIPEVLFHYYGSKRHPFDIKLNDQKIALNNFLSSNNIDAKITSGLTSYTQRVRFETTSDKKVSIIIPFKDQATILKKCVQSIIKHTAYKNYEIILVNHESSDNKTLALIKDLEKHEKVQPVLNFEGPFNYSKINNYAVSQCNGDLILFLNNDTEVLSYGWLQNMIEYIQDKRVAAVGAKLLYPDGTIQHAGVIIGIFGVAAHSPKFDKKDNDFYFSRANTIQNISACTAACLLVKREAFNEVGGFEEHYLSINFNDIDLCLKLREVSYEIIYTPFTELYHYESKSRGHAAVNSDSDQVKMEIDYFKQKWRSILEQGDPFYNPNLTKDERDFNIKR